MKLDNINKNIIKDVLKVKKSDKIFILYPNLYNELNDIKNKIDEDSDWDKMKKITNPYELIHLSFNKNKYNNSIANYNPLSRSYFKMIEIINKYDLLSNTNNYIKTASLAEGPGGFMEAIYNYRVKNNHYKDDIYGITLDTKNKYIPGWKKLKNIKKFNFKINYGDLYNINDVKKFTQNFKNKKADLVTADGGFDYSIDFNNQEQLSYRIIFCEIITAFGIQQIGGSFVCKIFDIFSLFTLKMIYLIYYFYDEIHLYKPKTSRIANSEKYIVAKGFKGITKEKLDELYLIIENWDDNFYVIDILGINFDNNFIHLLYDYNINFIKKQKKNILKTLKYVNNKPDKEKYYNIIDKQVNNAIEWCKINNIEINYKSRYLL